MTESSYLFCELLLNNFNRVNQVSVLGVRTGVQTAIFEEKANISTKALTNNV